MSSRLTSASTSYSRWWPIVCGAVARFNDDDVGRDVVTSEGTRVGTVNRVDEGRARVDRGDDESLTDKIKNMLGWENDDDDEIRDEHVDRREDDRIYLRQH